MSTSRRSSRPSGQKGRTMYDRAAIMRDAHRRYRDGQRLGLSWSFGRCLSTAWAAAKMRRELGLDRNHKAAA